MCTSGSGVHEPPPRARAADGRATAHRTPARVRPVAPARRATPANVLLGRPDDGLTVNHCRPTTRRLPDGLAPSTGPSARRTRDRTSEPSCRREDPRPRATRGRGVTYYLGIDVGAARTSAAVARAGSDDVEPVDLGDGGCGVASVLHLGADGSLDVGVAAERWADDEPDRVVRGFPGRIGDDVPMLLAGEPWAPEELTAWLVRWVVDRVAEREGGPAEAVAVTRPAAWDADRTELLAGALAEQDLDATFLTTARAAEWHSDAPETDGAAEVASAAACGAALALRAGRVGDEDADDVAARLAALAQFPSGDNGAADTASDADDELPKPAEVPAPRSHRSGAWSAGRVRGARGRVERARGGSGRRVRRPPGRRVRDDRRAGRRPARRARRVHRHLRRHEHRGPALGVHAAVRAGGLRPGHGPGHRGRRAAGAADAAQRERPVGRRPGRRRVRRGRRARAGRGARTGRPDGAQPGGAGEHRRCRSGGGRDRDTVPLAGAADDEQRDQPARAAGPRAHEPRGADLGPDARPRRSTPTPTPRPRATPTRTRRPAAPPPVVETTPAPSVTTEPTEPTATTSEPPPSESTAPTTTTEKPDDD